MRPKETIASALHLLVVLFCFTLALFSTLLTLRPDWRLLGSRWLLEEPQQFYWIGGGFALIGLFFALSFYVISRGKITRLVMHGSSISIDRKLLKRVVDDFFNTHFPGMKADVDLSPKEGIELSMGLPIEDSSQSDEFLKKVEEQLSTLFRERFGYDKPFTFSLYQSSKIKAHFK